MPTPTTSIEQVSSQAFIVVSLRSHYIASRLAAQMMVPRKQGLIITISSWGGLAPIFGVAYGAGKLACDRLAVMNNRFNWETPTFTGRVIAALLADPNKMKMTGKLQIVAELAAKYDIQDLDNTRPFSMRSLKFLLPQPFQNYRTTLPSFPIS